MSKYQSASEQLLECLIQNWGNSPSSCELAFRQSNALLNALVSKIVKEGLRTVDSREERIRRRAYELWEQNGKPEGGEMAFWLHAEQEIDANRQQPPDTLKGNVE